MYQHNPAKLFSVIQYHNYRKEHFLHIIGVFSDKKQAEEVFNSETIAFSEACKFMRDKTQIETIRVNNSLSLKIAHILDDEEAEWMVFALQEIETALKSDCLDLTIHYEFPSWVLVAYGEKSQPTICLIVEISASVESKEKLDFFTKNKLDRKGEVKLTCIKEKNYKFMSW